MAQVRDFGSTDDGNWDVQGGDFTTVADAAAVPQGIRIRVGMVLRECWLDEGIGIDYPNQILVKDPDPLVVRGLIGAEIAQTPDVTNVVGAQLVDEGERNASISYQVDTIYSEDPITEQVKVP